MRKIEITNLEDERTERTVIVTTDGNVETVIQPGRSAVVEVSDMAHVTAYHMRPQPDEELFEDGAPVEETSPDDDGSPASDALDSDGGTGEGEHAENAEGENDDLEGKSDIIAGTPQPGFAVE